MDFGLSFWRQVIADPLLLLAVALTLGVILVNGWTDAPNAIATCVTTRCMSAKAAVGMAAVCNFLGVLVMSLANATVAQTVTQMVDFSADPKTSIIALSAALFAIVLWATLCWAMGIPTSESHALLAGLSGGAVALQGSFRGINGKAWVKVLYGIGGSVLLGFALGWLVCRLITKLFYKANRPKTAPFFGGAQMFGAAAMAFMHGAQDGQKFMAVMLLCTYMAKGLSPPEAIRIPLWLMLLCSAVMAAGTAMGGKKIIKSVGMDMVRLEKYQGCSADIAGAAALLFCSVCSLPVSTTHAKTAAILGVGAVKRLSAINYSVVKEMALTWALTFPGCGAVGYLVTKLFMYFFA